MLDLLTWTPVALFLGIIVLLTTPFLAVVALVFAVAWALAAFAKGAVAISQRAGGSIGGRRQTLASGVEGQPPPVT